MPLRGSPHRQRFVADDRVQSMASRLSNYWITASERVDIRCPTWSTPNTEPIRWRWKGTGGQFKVWGAAGHRLRCGDWRYCRASDAPPDDIPSRRLLPPSKVQPFTVVSPSRPLSTIDADHHLRVSSRWTLLGPRGETRADVDISHGHAHGAQRSRTVAQNGWPHAGPNWDMATQFGIAVADTLDLPTEPGTPQAEGGRQFKSVTQPPELTRPELANKDHAGSPCWGPQLAWRSSRLRSKALHLDLPTHLTPPSNDATTSPIPRGQRPAQPTKKGQESNHGHHAALIGRLLTNSRPTRHCGGV